MTTQRADLRGLVDEMRAALPEGYRDGVLARIEGWANRLDALSAPGEPVAWEVRDAVGHVGFRQSAESATLLVAYHDSGEGGVMPRYQGTCVITPLYLSPHAHAEDEACPDCGGKGCVECDGPEHRSAAPAPVKVATVACEYDGWDRNCSVHGGARTTPANDAPCSLSAAPVPVPAAERGNEPALSMSMFASKADYDAAVAASALRGTVDDAMVERAAIAVYEAMPFDGKGDKPKWVERGNSLKQGEARQFARAALQAALKEGK